MYGVQMNNATKGLIIGSIICLQACGGSGTEMEEIALSRSEKLTLIDDTLQDIFDNFVEGQDLLASEDLPSGSALYAGGMAALTGSGDFENRNDVRLLYVGELRLEADFDQGSVTGEADNFINVENPEAYDSGADLVAGADVNGELTLVGVEASGADAQFDLLISGDLRGAEGDFIEYDGMIGLAEVYGAEADALRVIGNANGVPVDNTTGYIGVFGLAQK